MRLDGDAWYDFFWSFEREAWRLETLPVYTMPQEDEELQYFRETGKVKVDTENPYFRNVRTQTEAGKSIGRVHVIRRPLTDYLQWEFAAYSNNILAGEEVRIFDATDVQDTGLPNEDFWMFDSAKVVAMRYREDGTQIERELLDSPDVDQYRAWRDLAIAKSVLLSEFQYE